MRAYAYRAALYCEACAAGLRRVLDALPPPTAADRDDSDRYPQGPFPAGGGEADTPQHCEVCGVFLANPLTLDGAVYVTNAARAFTRAGDSWEDVARRAEAAGHATVAEWVRFYLAAGESAPGESAPGES